VVFMVGSPDTFSIFQFQPWIYVLTWIGVPATLRSPSEAGAESLDKDDKEIDRCGKRTHQLCGSLWF